ncbi:MCE family protein [Haematospirillum sp. H1815]|uniref:MlaD family protein n=1 Tax=Haematospirillum sp. H1815 TaxID=2723108 RepID=UPI00143C53A2|nr:MlaD family protein [Haematospirillum sp. H1815]NKD77122.1 MCE family protein [Haematospirillum sp. H1815]
MTRNPIETVIGALVLAVALLFLLFAWQSADLRPVSGYPVHVQFNKVGGLAVGADVRISGIKVGSVSRQFLDNQTYRAIVSLSIMPGVQLPEDTVASIASDGLLGGKFVRLEPGQSRSFLESGGTIANSQDFRSVEDMVSELIFLATKEPASSGATPVPDKGSLPE